MDIGSSIVIPLFWIGCNAARLSNVSNLMIGTLGLTNNSSGSAMVGSSLCGSVAKSGRLDRASAQFVFHGLYMSLMGYRPISEIYPDTRGPILCGCR